MYMADAEWMADCACVSDAAVLTSIHTAGLTRYTYLYMCVYLYMYKRIHTHI